MAPDQTDADIAGLPSSTCPATAGDAATIPWPNGDKVADSPLPANIDAKGLQAASDWAFTRASAEQVTLSLIVVHKGRIVHERVRAGSHDGDAHADVVNGEEYRLDAHRDPGRSRQAAARRAAWLRVAAATARQRGGSARRHHAGMC